jgi:hypothetical protein
MKQFFVVLSRYARSTDYWIGFIIGAILFTITFLTITLFNQANGFSSLEAIDGDVTFYHTTVLLAALEWPFGFPITTLLVSISAGFLRVRGEWGKPIGIILLLLLLIVYLAISNIIALDANAQGPSYLID